MKPDGTPSVEDILQLVDQLQEFEKRELVERINRGGLNTICGRQRFALYVY